LTLESSYCWEAPGGDTAEDTQYPKRSIRYFLQSYIVKQSDVDDLYEWMKTQWRATEGFSLPDSYPLHRVFLGECFWAPAFLYHNVPYYHHDGWVGGKAGDTIPKPILVATDQYAQEDSGFDCSTDESIRVYLPCKWIADGMNLHWRGIEGHFYDAAGNLVAFDPSVSSTGPGALLVDRELFLKHLDEQGHTLLWVVTGEKVIITGNIPRGDDWPGRLNILGGIPYTMRRDSRRVVYPAERVVKDHAALGWLPLCLSLIPVRLWQVANLRLGGALWRRLPWLMLMCVFLQQYTQKWSREVDLDLMH
jgi:hypothetical protein